MIVDIGGGTTEIAVITWRNVCDKSVKIAGDVLQMISYTTCVPTQSFVGESTAEKIKKSNCSYRRS
jgi:actin-like ATPase involved in cell morphogenesis